MTPRYIAARRAAGRPSRHLTRRQLVRNEHRFRRFVLLVVACLVLGACVIVEP